MIIVTYSKSGQAFSDFEIEDRVNSLHVAEVISDFVNVTTSTGNLISGLLCSVAENNLPADRLKIYFEGKEVVINEFGAILDWPKGFCSLEMDYTERILRAQFRRAKEKMKKEGTKWTRLGE